MLEGVDQLGKQAGLIQELGVLEVREAQAERLCGQLRFGNVKSPMRTGFLRTPMISSEREPMSDITTTDKEVKVAIELPGVSKEHIKINAYDGSVEVTTTDAKRKYHEVIEIPPETDIETAKSSYNNGILEITFKKKIQAKPKGKEIKVE